MVPNASQQNRASGGSIPAETASWWAKRMHVAAEAATISVAMRAQSSTSEECARPSSTIRLPWRSNGANSATEEA